MLVPPASSPSARRSDVSDDGVGTNRSRDLSMRELTPRSDDTFFSDILTAAVDGGVSHWATTGHIERFEDCYVRVQIRDIEGEMDWQVLDTAVVVAGINRICQGGLLAKESEHLIKQAADLQVAGLINPYLADYIVQAGLFGEVVFK